MSCVGEHSYYVADTVGVEKEGTVTVIAICTHCGDVVSKTVRVSEKGHPLKLASEETNKIKEK